MVRSSDWRSAIRLFFRQPGLTASAVLALGLGIGLTTLLFSLAYAMYFRGLPFPDGDRIMAISMTNVANGRQRLEVSIHDLADWRQVQRSFDDLAAFQMASFNVVVRDGQPERLMGALLTANGFDLLGARPLLGRTFVTVDGAPGAPQVLVLGHGAWMARFGGDPGVVGREVRANGEPATIVGVMPPGFGFPSTQEAWLPLRVNALEVPRGRGPSLTAYGRLKAATTMKQARAEFAAIGARLGREFPDTNVNLQPVVQPYTEMMVGGPDAATSMILTMAMGFAVLLIACANVANLLFARAASRTREIAIRSALGASRRRLIVQQLVETFVLAVAGTGVGLVVAWVGIDLLNRAVIDTNPPFWILIRLDRGPLLFAAAMTALAAVLAGGLPAWRASRPAMNEMLKDGARSAGGLRIGRISRILVTAEIVLSFALLSAAALTVRSILNLGTHQYGFAMDDVLTARLVLPEASYADAASRSRFISSLQPRLAALPGIEAATVASSFPALHAGRIAAAVDSVTYADPSHYPVVPMAAIAPRFFETFGRTVLSGRPFTEADNADAPQVAIVNASFAAQHMAGTDPIGRRIRLGRDEGAPWLKIVGLAPDMYISGAEDREPAGLYVPLLQSRQRAVGLALRGPGASMALVPAVRAEVSALDRDLPVYLATMHRKAVDDDLWAFTAFGPLLVAVGVAALFLAAVGLYSLMAFAARQRLREIGLRRALGAQSADIVRLVAREVSGQVGIGLLAGAGLTWSISGTMRSMVFHVQPDHPAVFAVILGTLVGAAAVAAFVPARRAVRVDPAVTLRDQ